MSGERSEGPLITDKEKQQRLWSRLIFFLGMLWGLAPFISLPFMMLMTGNNRPTSEVFASAFNGITVLPASVLAFRKRKIASWWLIADAVVTASATLEHPSNGHFLGSLLGIAAPLALGSFGLFSERHDWPPLLDSKEMKGDESTYPSAR
jgi:hypothetical protein